MASIEAAAVDFTYNLALVLADFGRWWPRAPYTDEQVDQLDCLYCRVELACDAMRQALVARRREAALREGRVGGGRGTHRLV
jgi:hypothetical protein